MRIVIPQEIIDDLQDQEVNEVKTSADMSEDKNIEPRFQLTTR